MKQSVEAGAKGGVWEVDEGVRRLEPKRRPEGRLAVGAGVFTAGAGAISYLGADPGALMAAGAAAAVCVGAGFSHRRGSRRDEISDHLTEQVCPLMGLPRPARRSVQLSGWSEGWIGTPGRVVLVYAAHLIPDQVWVAKIRSVVEQCLEGSYRVVKLNKRKHRLVLERYEQEAEAPLEKAEARVTEIVHELLGDSAQVSVQLSEDGDPRSISVKHNQGTNMAMANRRQRVQRVLATRIPGEWVANWDLQADTVEFQIRTPMPTLVYPPEEHSPNSVAHEAYMDFEVPLGEDEDGKTLTWFPRKQAHLLVTGQSGSGKTVVQHNVVQRLTQAGWRTWILDGKRIEFLGFRSWPNVELIASRLEHQVKMIVDAHGLMMRRYELIESGECTLADFEPLALVVDEATTFLKGADRWWKQVKPKGAPAKAPVLDLMADIARLARTAKIHMLLGLQRPDVEFVGGEMRDNFGARLAMGRLSPQGAQMMWNHAGIGTAVPRHIKGRGTAINADGDPVAIQTYLAPNPNETDPGYDPEATEKVRPHELCYSRKVIEILEPTATDIDGNEIPLMFDDYMDAAVTEAEEQPRVGGSGNGAARGPSAAALGALQKITGSRPVSAAASGNPDTPERESASSTEGVASEARWEPVGSAEEVFEGYDEAEDVGVLELNAGDLVLIDPEAGRWAVVQEDPEPDASEDVFLDVVDWASGDPESTSLGATEMVQVRRVLEEG